MRLSIVKIYNQYTNVWMKENRKLCAIICSVLTVRYCNGIFFVDVATKGGSNKTLETWASYSHKRTHTKKRASKPKDRYQTSYFVITFNKEEKKSKKAQQIEKPTNDCCLSDVAWLVHFGFSWIFFFNASAYEYGWMRVSAFESLCFNNIIYNSTNDGGPKHIHLR